jgi:hypothetical protein
MAYFLHMSEKEQIEFVEPIEILKRDNGYNPDGCLYLSQVIRIDDSELSSAWREHCKKFVGKDELLGDEETTMSKWVNGFQHFYKVDMNKDKIMIIKTRDDLRKLFENYGIIESFTSQKIPEIINEITIYQNFLKNLKKDKLDIVENHPEEIIKLVTKGKTHIVDIKYGMVVVPKNKGVTIEFVSAVFVKLKKLYDELMKAHIQLYHEGDGKCKYRRSQYSTINWSKMRDDGYSGIYYKQNIIDAAMSDKYLYDFDWKEFVKYLRADTLIVWKEDVITIETKENVLQTFA